MHLWTNLQAMTASFLKAMMTRHDRQDKRWEDKTEEASIRQDMTTQHDKTRYDKIRALICCCLCKAKGRDRLGMHSVGGSYKNQRRQDKIKQDTRRQDKTRQGKTRQAFKYRLFRQDKRNQGPTLEKTKQATTRQDTMTRHDKTRWHALWVSVSLWMCV